MVEIDIPLIEVDEVKTGRGGGKRGTGEKYAKYGAAIEPLMPWLEEKIAESKAGTILIKTADLARQMGMSKHETSIYWGVKFVMFKKGFVVAPNGKTIEENAQVLLVRRKKAGDVLPPSLAKHLGDGTGGGGKEEEKEEKQ